MGKQRPIRDQSQAGTTWVGVSSLDCFRIGRRQEGAGLLAGPIDTGLGHLQGEELLMSSLACFSERSEVPSKVPARKDG